MNTESDYLKRIALEIAGKQEDNELVSNDHLQTESKRLEMAIVHSLNSIENFTQRNTFHFNTLRKLINICDILYERTGTLNPDVLVLMELLTNIKQVIPDEIRPNLKLPKAFVEMQKKGFNLVWLHHKEMMVANEIDKALIEIAGIPFNRFTEPKQNLYWGDFTWLRGYQAKLEIMDWDNADCSSRTEALLSLLIGRDFNDDRFYIYCKKYIAARTGKITGKRGRLLEYAECEKLVLQDTQIGIPSFDARANSVSTRLLKWIKEEIDFVETHLKDEPSGKLPFQFFKYTLALFFKLLHEQKVFGEISFRELSKQIAGSCTAMGADVPADTIVKKAYLKKQVDFEQIEYLLVKMLEYLRRFK